MTAGTSDAPVAAEAGLTVAVHGAGVDRVDDVGVSGLHRLLGVRDRLAAADCLVVVAGMEGALPSVVGGLTGVPIVAVPTSVGYGAAFDAWRAANDPQTAILVVARRGEPVFARAHNADANAPSSIGSTGCSSGSGPASKGSRAPTR